MPKTKTWREKLEKDQLLKVVDDPQGRGKMLVPRPIDVDAVMRRVPKGKLITVDQIRARLAKDCLADFTCPLCTGIFLRISAETAEEDLRNGATTCTPWWRVIKADGSLNDKFPGGVQSQAEHLRGEGHTVTPGKGHKPPKVKDWEKVLQTV